MLERGLLFHIASGHAFFSGSACLLAAVAISPAARRGWLRRSRNLIAGLGGLLIAISGTPLPAALYLLLLLGSLLWIWGESRRERLSRRSLRAIRGAVSLAIVAAVVVEAPHHLVPRAPPLGRPVLGVVGDSITAGMGEPGVSTWPGYLADRFGVEVRDHAAMGATVASALKQAKAVTAEERLVLLEIGGNDLLGGTPPEAFGAGLEALLAAVCRPGRTVVMLELPLPPGYNRYGLAQRRLARKFGVLLVPKRILIGLLLRDGATVDTVHLSPAGQRWMGDALWGVLRPAFGRERPPDLAPWKVRPTGRATWGRISMGRGGPSVRTEAFLDSAYAIALAAPSDQLHARAIGLADALEVERTRLVTTQAVLLEIGNALAKRRYRPAAIQLLSSLEADPTVEIVALSPALYEDAFRLFRTRPDKEWGLIDCVSFVVRTERGITEALTSDEHFEHAGFRALLLDP